MMKAQSVSGEQKSNFENRRLNAYEKKANARKITDIWGVPRLSELKDE